MADFMENNNVNVNMIEKMSHPNSKYSSFKISIIRDKHKVLDPNFWPNGVQCRMWRSGRRNLNEHPFNNISDSDHSSDSDDENGSSSP